MFLRVFRSLDALVGGNEAHAKAWLRAGRRSTRSKTASVSGDMWPAADTSFVDAWGRVKNDTRSDDPGIGDGQRTPAA